MSLKINHKYSTAAGTPPASGDLDVGELAINAADAELYTKDTAGNIRKFQNTTTGTAAGVNFTQAGAGAVQRTVDSKLKDAVSVKDFGAVGDGVADDTAAIQAALDTTAAAVYFPAGSYRIAKADSSPALTSTVAGRKIFGEGVITATSQVRKAIYVTGARTEFTLDCDGNSMIGIFAQFAAVDCFIHHCTVRNLYSAANVGEVNGIRITLDGLSGGAVVSDNVFRNLESVGDVTGGNGVGMARAVIVEADSAQAAPILIANNRIDTVIGEEGDAIVVISSNGAGTYYKLNLCIQGNSILDFNRRGVKIQCSGATILGNTLRTTWGSAPATAQAAIDLVQGGEHFVSGNKLVDCKYRAQIKALENSASVSDIFVVNNVIHGIGSETSSALIYVDTNSGSSVVVSGNTISATLFEGDCITVRNTAGVFVSENTVLCTSGIPFNLSTGVSGLVVGSNNFNKSRSAAFRAAGLASADAFAFEVLGTNNRSLTLYNSDDVLNDGELISQIRFHQNDNNSNQVNASLRAIATGTTGATKLALHTGTLASPDVLRVEIGTSGHVTPGVDNTQNLGSASLKWATLFAGTGTINTSDAREKQQVAELTAVERQVAIAIKSLIKTFRFNDAVAAKGNEARIHVGVMAQDVEQVFLEHGLDPARYGLFCHDTWLEVDGKPIDAESGSVPADAVERSRLGVRYEELLAFVLAAL